MARTRGRSARRRATRRRRWRLPPLPRVPRLPGIVWALAAVAALAVVSVGYQLARKPTELLGLVAPSAAKTPATTWAEYRRHFAAHATPIMTPELLAALAQVESAGDPLARTYWRWRWSWNPLAVYAPASSAVGLLQLTDGTFEEARRLCIHGGAVVRDGPWNDPDSCWFNALYFRTVPSHAIEMTSARLHLLVGQVVAAHRPAGASLAEKQRLAAVIHLCGRQRGIAYARRGFSVLPGERCGDHDLARYLATVGRHQALFARMSRDA